MHTYRKVDRNVWQVGYYHTDEFTQVGPGFDEEFEAAAYANFLNGGRYSPGEIEPIFPKEYPDVTEDDSTPPDRPKALDDYPHEGLQSHRQARK
jgi:hypothetical protein